MKKAAVQLTVLVLLSLLAYPLHVNAQMNPPSAFYEYMPLTPRVGDQVVFNASRFMDFWTESTIVSLIWDFDDGSPTQSGTVLKHTFTQPGSYMVSLTAKDNRGLGQTSAYEVKVREQTPITIYESLSSGTVYIGQEVTISGNLTFNGKGVPSETVSFSTKVYLDEAPWVPIGTTKTQSDGTYIFDWATMKSSGYQVKAEWAGNTTYPKTSLTLNLYVVSYGDFITGFESNSTITNLSYNMTTRLLRFNAEGLSGTNGYVNVTIEKNSAFNPQTVVVLLDDEPIQYAVSSGEQEWVLSFNYHHSHHSIIVDFTGASAAQNGNEAGQSPDPTATATSPSSENPTSLEDRNPPHIPIQTTILTLAAMFAVIAAIVGSIVYYKKHRYSNKPALSVFAFLFEYFN